MKRVLVATGGGDCPGLNAVIRAIVKRAEQEKMADYCHEHNIKFYVMYGQSEATARRKHRRQRMKRPVAARTVSK